MNAEELKYLRALQPEIVKRMGSGMKLFTAFGMFSRLAEARLADKQRAGWTGWNKLSVRTLKSRLLHNVEAGDWVDVANLAMFYGRGGGGMNINRFINLCRIGIHRPLFNHTCSFIDQVSHKEVFKARCPCGKQWLVDSLFGWLGDKMEAPHD